MSKAIYRIYRPSTFEEVSGQEHIVRTLQNQHKGNALAHAYLFTGPRGVGKTTTARLMAKLVNCESPQNNEPCNTCPACVQIISGQSLDVYEIDAASQSDVENVRENVIKSVRFAPNQLKKKVYIIDEVHMLSVWAFNALLKTLEEPPEHALFILATTEIHKVPETIISRCQRFDFKRISSDILVRRMQGIVKEEGVQVDEDVLVEIARHSGGCARDAESLLGQVLALGDTHIGMEEASLVLPATQMVLVVAFAQALHNRQPAEAIEMLNSYLEQGVDLRHFVSDVIRYLRDRLLETVAGTSSEFDGTFLHQAIDALLQADRANRREQIPQLPVELAIITLCGTLPKQIPPKDFHKQEVVSVRVDALAQSTPVVTLVREVASESCEEIATPVIEELLADQEMTPVEKVFDSVPVMSIEQVKEKWPQVYEQIKSCNASLPMMMKTCEVCTVEEGRVELGFQYDLYVQTVNQEKNRLLIEGVFEQVLGKRLRVMAIQTKKEIEKDEVIQGLMQEFGGSVV